MIKGSLVFDGEVPGSEEAPAYRGFERENANVLPKAIDAWAIAFVIFSLAISLAFFWEGMKADFSSLSGDQINILSVAAKKDYPRLLEGDLVVGEAQNVDYYTPVFVNIVRWLSLPDHNYLRGLNILLLFTSLFYTLGWWALFAIWGNRWVAAILAFLVRGIMWPPGYELWGIAGIWTMLPRTLLLGLLPWILCFWFRYRRSLKGWVICCLACGLAVNIHPVSGVCVAASLLLAEITWTLTESKDWRTVFSRTLAGGLFIVIGMAPFIWTYASSLGDAAGVDPVEFYGAIRMRIDPMFLEPARYVEQWLLPKWLLLVLGPWFALVVIPRQVLREHKEFIMALGAFFIGCVAVALLPFAVEGVLHKLGSHTRVAFQLVRNGKYILVPSILLMGLIVTHGWKLIEQRFQRERWIKVGVTSAILVLTFISPLRVFDRVPFLGDDISRLLWPSFIKPYASSESMGKVLEWIRDNTDEKAKFVGPRVVRVGALRPVIYDIAGSGMLIEGNPKAFVEVARRRRQLKNPEYKDPVEEGRLYFSWGADYWITQKEVGTLPLAYADSGWFVYDLKRKYQQAIIPSS